MGTLNVRTYHGSTGSWTLYSSVSWTLDAGNYTVDGVYYVATHTQGLEVPTTNHIQTTGTGISGKDTTDPESDTSHSISISASGSSYCYFYYETMTETFTQKVKIIDEGTSSTLKSGSFTATDGDSYTTKSMMSKASVSIPSGYEFVESTINGSTYYESLSESFYADKDYPTLYVYVRVPVTEMTLTVKYYYNGTLYDSDTCDRTVGESYTIAECIEDAGISPSGEFINASYHATVYTDLDDEITIDDSYTTLKVYYQTETVTITLSLYLSGVLQSSANVTVNVGSTPTIASLIEDSEITVQSTWAFSSAVYNGTTYTSTSSTITAASGVTAMTLNYIVARTVTPYIFHNNSWREITATYIFTNGSWEECEPSLYIGGWK